MILVIVKLSKIILSYKFTDEHLINFNTTKDLKDDFTQFYKLSYEYETDCLFGFI